MSNLGVLFRVFLLSSFLAATSAAPVPKTNEMHITQVSHNSINISNLQGIECDSCQFVTHKIDDYIFHNEKVMGFVQS
jgi:hypothetical protein